MGLHSGKTIRRLRRDWTKKLSLLKFKLQNLDSKSTYRDIFAAKRTRRVGTAGKRWPNAGLAFELFGSCTLSWPSSLHNRHRNSWNSCSDNRSWSCSANWNSHRRASVLTRLCNNRPFWLPVHGFLCVLNKIVDAQLDINRRAQSQNSI